MKPKCSIETRWIVLEWDSDNSVWWSGDTSVLEKAVATIGPKIEEPEEVGE